MLSVGPLNASEGTAGATQKLASLNATRRGAGPVLTGTQRALTHGSKQPPTEHGARRRSEIHLNTVSRSHSNRITLPNTFSPMIPGGSPGATPTVSHLPAGAHGLESHDSRCVIKVGFLKKSLTLDRRNVLFRLSEAAEVEHRERDSGSCRSGRSVGLRPLVCAALLCGHWTSTASLNAVR